MKQEGQIVLPGWEDEIQKLEGEKKRRFLENLFTNLDRNVYALTNKMNNVVAATVIMRQSRAETADARELVWDELVSAEGWEELMGEVEVEEEASAMDIERARKVTRRVLDQYGDDSGREQASGYVMVQKLSVWSTTLGFVHPLLKRIEASTRYIDWGQKVNGKYRYVTPEFKSESVRMFYEEVMDNLFVTYGELWPLVWDYVVAKNPREEGVTEAAYRSAVRGRVCDNLRGLLPMGSETNFGLHADYRTFCEVILELMASGNDELAATGQAMGEELAKVNPEFVAMVDNKHGKAWQDYLTGSRKGKQKARKVFNSGAIEEDRGRGVVVGVLNKDSLVDITKSYLLDLEPGIDGDGLAVSVDEIGNEAFVSDLMAQLSEQRHNRRHHLPDFLRNIAVRIRFENVSFGSLKDFYRHRRVMHRTEPDVSGMQGIFIPKDILEMGGEVLEKYKWAQSWAAQASSWMKDKNELASRYLLTHGMKTSFTISCDLLEAIWIAELRSIASGFEEYRWFAQELWRQLEVALPFLKDANHFVDFNEYSLGRIREAVAADLKGRGEE